VGRRRQLNRLNIEWRRVRECDCHHQPAADQCVRMLGDASMKPLCNRCAGFTRWRSTLPQTRLWAGAAAAAAAAAASCTCSCPTSDLTLHLQRPHCINQCSFFRLNYIIRHSHPHVCAQPHPLHALHTARPRMCDDVHSCRVTHCNDRGHTHHRKRHGQRQLRQPACTQQLQSIPQHGQRAGRPVLLACAPHSHKKLLERLHAVRY
jgi:hypothetical protein